MNRQAWRKNVELRFRQIYRVKGTFGLVHKGRDPPESVRIKRSYGTSGTAVFDVPWLLLIRTASPVTFEAFYTEATVLCLISLNIEISLELDSRLFRTSHTSSLGHRQRYEIEKKNIETWNSDTPCWSFWRSVVAILSQESNFDESYKINLVL